jgi:hypothetical protein
MALPTADEFIADCWNIVRARGDTNEVLALRAEVGWGMRAAGATCFRDKIIEIVAEALPSKRILVMRRETGTPLVCTDKEGHPFRWHGEVVRVSAHVRMVALSLQSNED